MQIAIDIRVLDKKTGQTKVIHEILDEFELFQIAQGKVDNHSDRYLVRGFDVNVVE